MRASWLLILLSLVTLASAREWKSVTAKGQWDVTGDVSLAEAEERALFEAKKDAMRKAGVGTEVSSITVSSVTSDGEGMTDDFAQMNYIKICSDVVVEGEPKFAKEIDGNYFVVKCEIKAKVALKEKNHDPAFKIEVRGVKAMYNEGDKMEFEIRPTLDCYVRIFWITDEVSGSGGLLYPMSEYDSDIMLKGGKEYRFPLGYDDDPDGTEIDYTQRADRRSETNYMIVVGTKEKEAFVGDVDWKSLFGWLDGIDEKKKTEWVVKGVTVGK